MSESLFDDAFRTRLERARITATAALLNERTAGGWWTGELSASALSTATAVTALSLYAKGNPAGADRLQSYIERGYAWLIQHRNADGGWGDTVKSFSNISTTTLVWAAFGLMRERRSEVASAVAAAEQWLTQAAGSLEPRQLVRAIERRYGKDRTFSIPILTMCALCERLGPGQEGWRLVQQLPFEIAALPQRWFGALQLPVVSYALPALIAIGQVRHGMRPTRNPLLRALRNRCVAPTLHKLTSLQPDNGGFLEATPLTSFVTMSLSALGLTDHRVAQRGIEFLTASVRPDGSWPIDTNLATWTTTLSVNALAEYAGGPSDFVPTTDRTAGAVTSNELDRAAIRRWLLQQQGRIEHPYTLAAPGGWAWTDLPGGVPDADDTAGALLALHRLGPIDQATSDAAKAGVGWLLALQNRDGGIPTFCRGWGRLPFDRSSPDLTAHAVRAWRAWQPEFSDTEQRKIVRGIARAAAFLRKAQRKDGAWIPLWFGHQENPDDENPLYGTSRIILAFCDLNHAGFPQTSAPLDRAINWLVSRQNSDGGWSGAIGAASSTEESGVALEALVSAWERKAGDRGEREALRSAIARGARWIITAVENEQWRHPAPIGFYFAKLWYYERLYPMIFAVGALNRLTKLAPSSIGSGETRH